MDKNRKMDEIKELVEKKQYSLALQLLESMDVQTELTQKDLSVFAEVYICNRQYSKAKALLEVMYKNNATKKVISQLIYVCLIMGDIDDAEKYYKSYVKIAPNDVNAVVFRYRIDKAKNESPKILIKTLEKLEIKSSYSDEFAYDLSELYYQIKDMDKCIKKCNEMIVLSTNQSYVKMANSLKDKAMKVVQEQKKETISLGDLLTTKDEEKSSIFSDPVDSMFDRGSDIDNIEAKARLNIELSAKKALENKFSAIEEKKREVERKLKLEESARKDLEKKIKNYEVIKKSLEDKINIQNKDRAYLEELLEKSELNRKECEQKFNIVYEQKINIENKFNKLDEISKSQSEKLVREVANSRKLDERLQEREMKVNQLIERLQLEEKTKSQLINNLETKEKFCENLEARLQNCEKVKSDLEVRQTENNNKIKMLEVKLAAQLQTEDTLNMQVKNLMTEKAALENNLRQLEQNCKVLQHNLSEHVKNKQMLENRCGQIMEHKRHMEIRYRETDTLRKELEEKLHQQEQEAIILEDSLRETKEDFESYKKSKENEITRLNETHEKEKEKLENELTSKKEEELQNLFATKEHEIEKIKEEASTVENDLKIEKEQLKRRYEKDMTNLKETSEKELSDMKASYEKDIASMKESYEKDISNMKNTLEAERDSIKTKLEAELDQLHDRYDSQKERLDKCLEDNRMLDGTLKEKISIINSLDARIKDVMTERKRLADKSRELEHRLRVEIGNNKKLDDMVTMHIEGKTNLETQMAKDKEELDRLSSKNKQGAELIKKLEERVQVETNNRINLEKKLHDTGIRCANLEKELRDLKTQLKQQRDKEISLVEKSGEELLSMTFSPEEPNSGIELDDLGLSSRDDQSDGSSPYDTLTTSVSQFLDEIVDDFDDSREEESVEVEDETNIFEEGMVQDEVQGREENFDDVLPMIDMKDIEAELNLAPHSDMLEEVTDVNQPAPRLNKGMPRNETIGSFFDSEDVPEYKKNPYDNNEKSVVSELFGSSEKESEAFQPNDDEKKQFYQEIMHSQLFDPFANNSFSDVINGDYKTETINTSIFAYYYFSPSIMDMIQKVVFGINNNRLNNHIVISGPDCYDKIELSKMIAKQLAEKNIISTNKIARISGEAFNKVDLDEKAPKLLDGTVIIQNAETINSAAYEKLARLINNYQGRIVIILETSMAPAMLFANNQAASKFFRGIINLPKYSVNFILEYVRTVLTVRGMGISQEAENDMANMFNMKIKNNNQFTLDDLYGYVNSAIETALKRKKGKGKHPTDIIIRQDINTNW